MATLERPGVEVEQVVTNDTPTAIGATLPACIVGPCFQIVSPLTTDGVLNSDAAVITPAMIVGDQITEPVACLGQKLKVNVNGGTAQIIVLPTSLSGNPLSFNTIKQSINKQLVGATVDFVDGRLVFKTSTKGADTSLYLDTPPATSAYTALGLSNVSSILFKGKSKYDNLSTTIPFSALPVTKTGFENLSFYDSDQISLYRYYGSSLKALSKTSAPLHNSWSNGAVDAINNVEVDNNGYNGNYYQPLVSQRLALYGLPIGASKTNSVFHPGVPASVKIPLSRTIASVVCRPDPTDANYLYVEALGLQAFLTNKDAVIGNYIGKAGNGVSVKITCGATTGVAWDNGNNQLVITLKEDGTTGTSQATYANLSAALNDISGSFDATKHLALSLRYTDASAVVLEDNIKGANALTFYLSGGSDPLNFGATEGAIATNAMATITGSVKVGAATTAADLGIASEWLELSMNGLAPVKITFAGGTAVITSINNALAAASAYGTAGTTRKINNVAVTAYARAVTLKTLHGESVDVLQLVANPPVSSTLYREYQESTLHITGYSSTKVIAKLFGGALLNTSRGLAITPSSHNAASGTSLYRSVYNPSVGSLMEKAVVPGYQSITLNNVKSQAAIVFYPDTAAAVWADVAAMNIVVSHSAVASGAPQTVSTTGSQVDFDDFWSNVTDHLGNNAPLAAAMAIEVRTVAGSKCVIFTDLTGTGSIKVLPTTSAAVQTALLNGSTNGTEVIDATVTSATATLTLTDTGSENTLQVVATSNNLANAVFGSNLGFLKNSAYHLTSWFLDDAACYVKYGSAATTGDVFIKFNKTAAGTAPAAAFFSSSTADITWKQAWANAFGPISNDYVGRVFTGGCAQAKTGDSLYNANTLYGHIASIGTLVVGSETFAGALLQLSGTPVVGNYEALADWHVQAEALDTYSPARNVTPELDVDLVLSQMTIKQAVNRSAAGIAAADAANLYAGYKALRLDVTAAAANPAVRYFSTVDEVETQVGPVTPDNPLAFGLSKAFDNVTNVQVLGFGVDEVTADAPEGTAEAYGRAFEVLELAEMYGIAPMTYNREVHKLLATHCTNMSLPEGKKERAGVVATTMPVEKESTLCLSGVATAREDVGGTWVFTFADLNVPLALTGVKDANGDTIDAGVGAAFSAENGIYLDRSGDPYKYLVTGVYDVNSVIVTLAYPYDAGSGPGTGGNDDGYYKEDAAALADYPAAGEYCSLLVRQASIDATTTTGKNEQVEAISAFAQGFGMSRFMEIQPEEFGTLVNGTEVLVPSYYFCAAWVGATSQLNPAQGMTNLPINGFTRPIGSNDKFTEKQMAVAAAGGVNWIIQDSAGGPVYSRHQLTTNTASLKTREWSVVKSVDTVAKVMRESVRRYVGRYNITKALLEEISLVLTGVCASLGGVVVAEVNVDKISVPKLAPDHIEIDVTCVPFYPANKIKIRIAV